MTAPADDCENGQPEGSTRRFEKPNMRRNKNDPTDTVGDRTTSAKFMSAMFRLFDRPSWLLAGTSLEGQSEIPERITVRDDLIMAGNLADNHPDPAYHVTYLTNGVPTNSATMETALRAAPNLWEALNLLSTFGGTRRRYHVNQITEEDGWVALEIIPTMDLGRSRQVVNETPLLYISRLASRMVDFAPPQKLIEFSHPRPVYADRLEEAFGCSVTFEAKRNAISFPSEFCRLPNLTYEPHLWHAAKMRCEEEFDLLQRESFADQLKLMMSSSLNDTGRLPRLEDVSHQLGLSKRSVIRQLRAQGLTYQSLLDSLRKNSASRMLADWEMPLHQISEELGFSDTSSFFRSFKRWYGMTPQQFRSKSTVTQRGP